jgi:drug/metabolite transporter (DMT)-like permease
MQKRARRILAGLLILVGALMLLLATETTGGVLLILAGVVIEGVGIALEHR